jgi:hypothetical protein
MLASKDDLFLVPGMRFSAMATGYSPGLELGGGKDIFFDHHPCDIEFFCYRTSHQDSLDHSTNISQPAGESSRNLVPGVQPRRPFIPWKFF